MSLFYPLHIAVRTGFTLLLFVFCIAASVPSGAAAGPLESLAGVQRGIDECDSDSVTRTVDIPSVVGKASDSLVEVLQQQSAEGTLGDSNLAMVLALAGVAQESGQAAMIRQLLISEVRGFVVSGVNGGYFAGKPNGSVKPSRTSLAGSLEKMPQGRRQVIPGRILSQQDGAARVSATFVDPKAGRLPLELAMEEREGVWRVVEIVNARALFQEVAQRNR